MHFAKPVLQSSSLFRYKAAYTPTCHEDHVLCPEGGRNAPATLIFSLLRRRSGANSGYPRDWDLNVGLPWGRSLRVA